MCLTRGHAWLICLAAAACSGRSEDDRSGAGHAADSAGLIVGSESLASSTGTDSVRADSAGSEWLIAPGRSGGALTAETSEEDLRKRYGSSAIETSRIEIGEGETMPGAVLYPGDSLRRVEIIWRDSVERRRPARVILRGNESRWTVGEGVSLGTSLKDLERLNGRPFTLAGFGWDYAGVVTDWKGGKLHRVLTGIKLYLDPGPAAYRSADYSQVLGDRDYSSALPPMQQLNPRVAQIFVDFEGR
jgi:hypothetical protein